MRDSKKSPKGLNRSLYDLAKIPKRWLACALIVLLLVWYMFLPGNRIISEDYVDYWGLSGIERVVPVGEDYVSIVMKPDSSERELMAVLERRNARRKISKVFIGDISVDGGGYGTTGTKSDEIRTKSRRVANLAIKLRQRHFEALTTLSSYDMTVLCKPNTSCSRTATAIQSFLTDKNAPDWISELLVTIEFRADQTEHLDDGYDTLKLHPYWLRFRPKDTPVLKELLAATQSDDTQTLLQWRINTALNTKHGYNAGFSKLFPETQLEFENTDVLLDMRKKVINALKAYPSMKLTLSTDSFEIFGQGDISDMNSTMGRLHSIGAQVTSMNTDTADDLTKKTDASRDATAGKGTTGDGETDGGKDEPIPQIYVTAARSTWAQVKSIVTDYPSITTISVHEPDGTIDPQNYRGTIEEFQP
jgi:hypothetical protein